jgi:signal peptide peptidase SppA
MATKKQATKAGKTKKATTTKADPKQKTEKSGMFDPSAMFDGKAWGIEPASLDRLMDLAAQPAEALSISFDVDGDEATYMQVNGDGVAIIQVMGPMIQRGGIWTMIFGGTDTELLRQDLERAAADDDVKAVMLHIDSPGGMIDGTQQAADAVRMLADVKPTYAFTDGSMTSAAYWLAAGARKIFAVPTAWVGSIGVVATHVDRSGFFQRVGIRPTFITSGRYKRMGNEAEPLSDEAREYLQGLVDETFSIFAAAVADMRGVDEQQVRDQQARVYLAQKAADEGLVDQVGTFNEAYTAIKRKELKQMNLTEFKADHADLFNQVLGIGRKEATAEQIVADNPALADSLRTEGADAERKRISGIYEAAFEGQDELVKTLVEGGTPVGEAVLKLNQDQKQKMEGEKTSLLEADPGDLGANPAQDPVDAKKKQTPAPKTAKSKAEAGDMLDEIAQGFVAADGMKYGDALKKACAENPELERVYTGRE